MTPRRWMRGAAAVLVLALAGCAGQRTSQPLAVPDVEMALAPASGTVAPGTTGTYVLTLRPVLGFQGDVRLAADTGTAGLSVQFSPAQVHVGPGDATSTVSVRVPVDAIAGPRDFTLRALGDFGQHDLPVRVSVPAAQVLPVTTFVNSTSMNLPFMYFKDGDGPWRPLEGSDGAYRAAVTDPAGRYGLAYGYLCTIGSFRSHEMNYLFQTLKESASLTVYFLCNPLPGPPQTLFALEGGLRGQGGEPGYLVTSAGALRFDRGASSYRTQVVKGTGDLAAWTFSDPATLLPTRFFLDRGREAKADAVRDVDFASEGFAPGPTLPIAYGSAAGPVQGEVRYFTAGGEFFVLSSGAAPSSFATFPSDRARSGDSYAHAFGTTGNDRSEMVYGGGSGTPGPLSIQFPTAVAPFTVTWPAGAYLRPAFAWTPVSPEPLVQEFSLLQRAGSDEAYWFIYFSEGWLGPGSHAFEMPDFTGLPGWDDAFGFRPSVPVSVRLGQFGVFPGGVASARSGAAPSWRPSGLRELGASEGRFRILGLAAATPGDSFQAVRATTSTP